MSCLVRIGIASLLLVTLLPLVHAASVNVSPNILIRTQFGQLSTINPQTYLNFTVFANATIAFYVTPSPSYTFTAKGYGNGSMLVKFFGPRPVQVNTNLSPTYNNGRLLLTYSSSLTETLVVIYSQAVIIANDYSNASFLWLSLFGLVVISAFLFPHLNLLAGTKGRMNSKGREQKRIYTAEEYEKEVKQRTKIVIIFLVIGAIVSAFAAYFLTVG